MNMTKRIIEISDTRSTHLLMKSRVAIAFKRMDLSSNEFAHGPRRVEFYNLLLSCLANYIENKPDDVLITAGVQNRDGTPRMGQ